MKRKSAKTATWILAVLLGLCLALTACGGAGGGSGNAGGESGGTGGQAAPAASSGGVQAPSSSQEAPAAQTEGAAQNDPGILPAPEIAGLTLESALEKEYATQFDVFSYSDGYKVLSVSDGRQYLLVPEGKEVPEGLAESIIVLKAPLDHTYLAATSAMALINACGATDNVTMTGTDADDWYIDEVKEAVKSGKIEYVGKYSEPDYEKLIDGECNLALESTMILHSPKVQEMIEKMDIPVFIDRSSYETHPLGRTEWIKLYGALYGKEEEAKKVFDSKSQIVKDMKDFPNTEKTVAYFNIKTDGTAVVRNPEDYVASMIELGGARYAFGNMEVPVDAGSTLNISMEEFYATASDADYLIYNATISDPIKTVDDLLKLSPLFADFKAVKEGNVWLGGNNMYQATDIVGDFILDVNNMVTGGPEEKMVFLKKVN